MPFGQLGNYGGNAVRDRVDSAVNNAQGITPAKQPTTGMGTQTAAASQVQAQPQPPVNTQSYYQQPQLAPIAQDIQSLQKTYPNPMQMDAKNYRYFAGDAKNAGLPPAFAENVYMSGWNPMGNR